MNTPDRKQLTELIIQWVRDNTQSNHFSEPEITGDTDLMATGLLDSFGFIDLLLYVEGQTGIKVDLTDVDPSEFTVVNGLCDIALGAANNSHEQPLEFPSASSLQQIPS
jgi:acyl carrier protein